ncbi:MAG: type II toxin-antitoxin system RelE family toxin [Nitrososphaerales archaeon]
MAFTIQIKRRALRSIEELQEKRKKEIGDVLFALREEPVPFRKMDVTKLKGYDNIYRIRVGETRIVYAVSWADRNILVHYVGPRGNAYG